MTIGRRSILPVLALSLFQACGYSYWRLDGYSFSVRIDHSEPVQAPFSSSSWTIAPGQSVKLSWTVNGNPTPNLMLNPGNINVTGKTACLVRPKVTTVYTLKATNAHGSTERSMTVIVSTGPRDQHPSI